MGYLKSLKMIPHSVNMEIGGEDCHFENKNIMVVAHGISGWTYRGYDAPKYPKKLCQMSN